MSFYTNLKSTAQKLLQSKGQSVTITTPVSASFNPVTGVETPDTSVTITGYGAVFDYDKREIDSSLVQAGDIKLLFEATDTAPTTNSTVVIDSTTYRVMSVKSTSPAGTVVMYELQLRR